MTKPCESSRRILGVTVVTAHCCSVSVCIEWEMDETLRKGLGLLEQHCPIWSHLMSACHVAYCGESDHGPLLSLQALLGVWV